jgi:hypothetical protein
VKALTADERASRTLVDDGTPASSSPGPRGWPSLLRSQAVSILSSMEIQYDGDEWTYAGDDDVLGVSVTSGEEGSFQVFVAAAEFVREEPLEGRLRAAVARELAAVEGVEEVFEEDREVWTVEGTPSGEALAKAVASVVNTLHQELQDHLDTLG